MSLRLYDAHNHLQDERFGSQAEELLAASAPVAAHWIGDRRQFNFHTHEYAPKEIYHPGELDE